VTPSASSSSSIATAEPKPSTFDDLVQVVLDLTREVRSTRALVDAHVRGEILERKRRVDREDAIMTLLGDVLNRLPERPQTA
jgi:hypothetical protein